MTMHKGWATTLSCALVMSAGCDAQAPSDYRGESLLTLLGNVEIPEANRGEPLVPALVFMGPNSELHVVDVAVKGQFPADFRIDVYEPPPRRVIESDEGASGQPESVPPRGAWGFITAVPVGHADMFRLASLTTKQGFVPCLVEGCHTCEEEGRCESESAWCTWEGECYRETKICPLADSPPEDCTVEHEGDPQLKEPAWSQFAGFSQNYHVLYLEDPAPADSVIAKMVHATGPLAAGYHLIAVRAFTEQEREKEHECSERADDLGVARINERLGTRYSYDEIFFTKCWDELCEQGWSCPVSSPDADSELCSLSEKELEAFHESADATVDDAALELGCETSFYKSTLVPDASRERISVKLSADSDPISALLPRTQ